MPLEQSGKAGSSHNTASQETCQVHELQSSSGEATHRSIDDMTTQTLTSTGSRTAPAFLVAVLGLAIMVITGHVQADTLHDAAHDVRHATGFPCH